MDDDYPNNLSRCSCSKCLVLRKPTKASNGSANRIATIHPAPPQDAPPCDPKKLEQGPVPEQPPASFLAAAGDPAPKMMMANNSKPTAAIFNPR